MVRLQTLMLPLFIASASPPPDPPCMRINYEQIAPLPPQFSPSDPVKRAYPHLDGNAVRLRTRV